MSAAIACTAICLAMPSSSNVIDRPHYKVDGMVIVWAADAAGNTPIASDFIIEDGGANTDLISTDTYTVVTGTLDALDESFAEGYGAALRIQRPGQTTLQGDRFTSADDTLNPIALRNNTDVRTIRSEIESSFFVASNKAFNIDVVASSLGDPADLNLIRLRMRLDRTGTDGGLSYGTSAQFPHTGNSTTAGLQWTNYRRLSNLTTNRDIYRGNRRTAASAGTIADQSVRFDLDYRWNTGNIDLAEGTFDVEAQVDYTVYIP
jgi:hypothetical protein